MSFYVFIYEFVDLPLFIVIKALPSLCCVMFHIYDVGCWKTNLKLSYTTETHRVHGSRLLFLIGKYAKTSFDELSWKILNESRIFLHIITSLSKELFYFECL